VTLTPEQLDDARQAGRDSYRDMTGSRAAQPPAFDPPNLRYGIRDLPEATRAQDAPAWREAHNAGWREAHEQEEQQRQAAAREVAGITELTIRHTSEDGTGLEGSSKGDGAWEILRARGWKFSRRFGIYLGHTRDKAPKRGEIEQAAAALRAAGFHVDVEIDAAPRPMAESEADRAEHFEGRAEHYADKAERKVGEAKARFAASDAISEHIPMGQPVLVGHHSQRRHERDLERMHNHDRAGIEALVESRQAANTAASSAAHMQHRENPATTANRIDRLAAEERKIQRDLTPCARSGRRMKPDAEGVTITCPTCYADFTIGEDLTVPEHGAARDGHREQLLERLEFLRPELAHWRDVLAAAQAAGAAPVIDWSNVQKGDRVRVSATRWGVVVKVNKVTVAVQDQFMPWPLPIKKHQVLEHEPKAADPEPVALDA
jgi:hypothetical protein